MGPRKDLAALAGIVAPVVFGFGIVALTVAQYDYMTGLGWRPFDDSSGVPWPSGLALGPLGFLQVANFVLFGVLLIFFALGLHRGVAPGARGSKAGPALLMVAGFAMLLAGFEADPDISGGPQTWHGLIHSLAYLLFVFSLLPAFFVIWRRLRRDPHWRGYDLFTLITGILYVVLLFLASGAVAFYLFLALVLVWIEVMALRLRALTVGAPADVPRRQTDGEDNWRQDVAKAGDTIENPLSGERITFLEVPSEANGDLLRFYWRIPPGFSIPEHVHIRQEERHEILSDTLRGRVAGREQDYVRDHRIIGPPGVPHAWRNPNDDEELRIVSELQPALGFESLLETGFAIARDLKTDRMGAPKHLLRIFILLDEAGGEFYPAGVPMPVWRTFLALVAVLARVGKLLGYEAHSPVRRPTRVWGRVAVVVAAGLAVTKLFALLRRRSGNRRSISR